MKFIFAVLICLFSFSAQAEVSITSQHTATKPHARLPIKRSQKALIRAPGEMDDNDTDSDDIYINVGYRRPELDKPIQPQEDDPDLSDYIQLRLLVARTKALKKFVETHGQVV